MDLPDLPPDLAFARLARTDEAIEFAFEVKRAAMGPIRPGELTMSELKRDTRLVGKGILRFASAR